VEKQGQVAAGSKFGNFRFSADSVPLISTSVPLNCNHFENNGQKIFPSDLMDLPNFVAVP